MIPEFVEFPKISRLSRPCIITEKIDGTSGVVYVGDDGQVIAGSRSRWLLAEDNYGFAAWVKTHEDELRDGLGAGRHFGEWWGRGIQKRYPMVTPKRFSLFNVSRWRETRPACCDVVPVLYEGLFTMEAIEAALQQLRDGGSVAAPGCPRPEGVVIFHIQGHLLFKKTLEKDEQPKGQGVE